MPSQSPIPPVLQDELDQAWSNLPLGMWMVREKAGDYSVMEERMIWAKTAMGDPVAPGYLTLVIKGEEYLRFQANRRGWARCEFQAVLKKIAQEIKEDIKVVVKFDLDHLPDQLKIEFGDQYGHGVIEKVISYQ